MEPRMQKYSLTDGQIIQVIDNCQSAVLCTNGSDGYPYGTPVNFIRIGNSIFIHGREQGTKISNVLRDSKCSMTFYEDHGFESTGSTICDVETIFRSAIVYGRMKPVTDYETKARALRMLSRKLMPDVSDTYIVPSRVDRTGVFELRIEMMTGKYHEASNRS